MWAKRQLRGNMSMYIFDRVRMLHNNGQQMEINIAMAIILYGVGTHFMCGSLFGFGCHLVQLLGKVTFWFVSVSRGINVWVGLTFWTIPVLSQYK